ncbi:MAG: cyclase family protein, partial [Flavobacteriales bacterium]
MKSNPTPALVYLLLLAALVACTQQEPHSVSQPFADVKWIDLTYPFDSTTLYWPNNANGFKHSVDFKGVSPMGYFYSSYSLSTPEHGGTHLDAPVHFAEGRESTDAVPLTSLTGEAVVIDVS